MSGLIHALFNIYTPLPISAPPLFHHFAYQHFVYSEKSFEENHQNPTFESTLLGIPLLPVKFPVCVVKSPNCVRLLILPSKNSSWRYAALGAYCGTTGEKVSYFGMGILRVLVDEEFWEVEGKLTMSAQADLHVGKTALRVCCTEHACAC